jgi:hypothetical protein
MQRLAHVSNQYEDAHAEQLVPVQKPWAVLLKHEQTPVPRTPSSQVP